MKSKHHTLDRRHFLQHIGLGAAAMAFPSCTEIFAPKPDSKKKKPNIIVFFIDDLGYADVGYHGCKDIATPNIDSIAANGAQFSTAYVTAPVCGPSRAGLLTGRYQQRFGFEDNPGPFRKSLDTQIGIPRSEKTIGHRLQALGYKTAFIGKHHSGVEPRNNPVNLGFDFFFGFDDGSTRYMPGTIKKGFLRKNLQPVEQETDYLTDAFGREAVSFIQKNKEHPFFLYLPFNAVHDPLEAPESLIKKYNHIKHPKRRILAAMLDSVDTNIGKILEALRANQLEDNTLIVFASDNGGAAEKSNFSYNEPLREVKGSLYEGGIRVPFCVQWKHRIPAGQTLDFPIHTLDILPTVIAATGNPVPATWKLDGMDLLGYLAGKKKTPPERFLYWRMLYGWAIRDNTWKLVKSYGGRKWRTDHKIELYRIASDVKEEHNLIHEYPEVAKRLQDAWNSWSATLMEPQWGWQKGLCGTVKIPLATRK